MKKILLSAALFVTSALPAAATSWVPVASAEGMTMYIDTDTVRQVTGSIYSAESSADEYRFTSSGHVKTYFDCSDMTMKYNVPSDNWTRVALIVGPACRIMRGY